MDNTICESISSYTEISCDDAQSASAVALPVMEIGTLLIIIIALAVVGLIMRKYVKKVKDTRNSSLGGAVERAEQDKLLNQKF